MIYRFFLDFLAGLALLVAAILCLATNAICVFFWFAIFLGFPNTPQWLLIVFAIGSTIFAAQATSGFGCLFKYDHFD